MLPSKRLFLLFLLLVILPLALLLLKLVRRHRRHAPINLTARAASDSPAWASSANQAPATSHEALPPTTMSQPSDLPMNEDDRWKALIRESEKAIDQYLVPGINMDLDLFIPCITFRVFSVVFLGVDSNTLAPGNMELVTEALTDYYNDGQGKNTLPVEVQIILNEWLPPRQFPFSLDRILPAYEALWRIVATVVVTCEDDETRDLRWVMLDFRDNPRDRQYRSSFGGGRKSAEEITKEVVEGIALPFARTQEATTSTWPLSCIQYATRSAAGPSPTEQEALKFAALLASKVIGRIGVHYRISDGAGSQAFPWEQRKIYRVGRAADHVSINVTEIRPHASTSRLQQLH